MVAPTPHGQPDIAFLVSGMERDSTFAWQEVEGMEDELDLLLLEGDEGRGPEHEWWYHAYTRMLGTDGKPAFIPLWCYQASTYPLRQKGLG